MRGGVKPLVSMCPLRPEWRQRATLKISSHGPMAAGRQTVVATGRRHIAAPARPPRRQVRPEFGFIGVGGGLTVHFELLRGRSILAITPDGPLDKADFEQLASEIEPVIASEGKLASIMICAKSFPGWRN